MLARVDGPLDETVPARRPITVEDLLTFRMGFGMLTEPTFNPPFPIVTAADELRPDAGPAGPAYPHPPDEWIRLFGTLPLMYQPGERWQYNAGALVLGVLVARAGGQPSARCCGPACSSRSAWWTPASPPPRRDVDRHTELLHDRLRRPAS